MLGIVVRKLQSMCVGWLWRLTGTLGGRLFEFVSTFGVWIIAERLHLSAILCVVAFAMTIARYNPERQPALDRLHSYSVWETTVFVLNVLAFLLLGLQARAILMQLDRSEIWHASGSRDGVVVVIVVRIIWVMIAADHLGCFSEHEMHRHRRRYARRPRVVVRHARAGHTCYRVRVAGWISPRDLIVLTALIVVLGR